MVSVSKEKRSQMVLDMSEWTYFVHLRPISRSFELLLSDTESELAFANSYANYAKLCFSFLAELKLYLCNEETSVIDAKLF